VPRIIEDVFFYGCNCFEIVLVFIGFCTIDSMVCLFCTIDSMVCLFCTIDSMVCLFCTIDSMVCLFVQKTVWYVYFVT